MAERTPLMRQYEALKAEHPGTLLLFRVGDFYELFGDDAVTAAPVLQIALTSRDKNRETPIPLCGVPHHSVSGYLAKLLGAGYRVALAEQMEEPKPGTLVERRVVRVLTPGTVLDDELLPGFDHAFLAAVLHEGGLAAIARMDLSTGHFDAASAEGPYAADHVADELARTDPREVLVGPGWDRDFKSGWVVHVCPREAFDLEDAERALREQFPDPATWEHLDPAGRRVAGALLRYARHTLKDRALILAPPPPSDGTAPLDIDESARRTLELTAGTDGTRRGSLLACLDATRTPMGARLLRERLLRPLASPPLIEARLDDVSALLSSPDTRAALRDDLRRIGDIERALSRAASGLFSPRDLAQLARSLETSSGIGKRLAAETEPRLRAMADGWEDFGPLVDRLSRAIVPDPPATARDGGVIRDGYHADLDALRSIRRDGSVWLTRLESRERARTGIDSLKVRHNQVFGYYLEVTKANAARVPSDYQRRQTLSNAERYTIPDLAELESKILSADDKIRALELMLVDELRVAVMHEAPRLRSHAARLAKLDVAAGLAAVAESNRWTRPTVVDHPILTIRNGRHPVVERQLTAQRFVPNDTDMDGASVRLILLTGPNMAGKSTYMRQVALTVVMAQMGSYVPADDAVVGVVDRLFARVGAYDDIAGGRSTFMVEMSETASILAHATSRSLILLDEIGRGTSTFDGISIAWAVAEDVHTRIGARTLFATHYHELTSLADTLSGLKNYKAAVREWNDEIVFMRKIVEGGADRSYGIQVARLAGLPAVVVGRAREILRELERVDPHHGGPEPQPDLFTSPQHPVLSAVAEVDISRLTPIDALVFLNRLKQQVDSSAGPRPPDA